MWVVFRTGGGKQAGFGHVRRCLSLANALRSFNMNSSFVLDGDVQAFQIVQSEGHAATLLSEDDRKQTSHEAVKRQACAVVVDFYGYTTSYLENLRQAGNRVAVLDDLAEHPLPVDMVINGTAGAEHLPYAADSSVTYLLGSRYILLRPEFVNAAPRSYDGVRRILITLGGSDAQ